MLRYGFGIGIAASLMLLLAFTGCDAPRDNPLDPESDYYIPPIEPDHPAQFFSFSITTSFIRPSQEESPYREAMAKALISDSDKIARVYLEIGDSLRRIVNYSEPWYLFQFNSNDEFQVSLQNMIGVPFRFIVYDSLGHVTTSDQATLTRLLDQIPSPVYPTSIVLPDSQNPPTLVWQQYQSDYNITYKVQVRQITSTDTITCFSDTDIPRVISPGDTVLVDSVTINRVLEDGQYLWHVETYDSFGNMARSASYIFFVGESMMYRQRQDPGPDPVEIKRL